jgi:hypothetical protein
MSLKDDQLLAKEYTRGYQNARAEEKKRVAELKKRSIDGRGLVVMSNVTNCPIKEAELRGYGYDEFSVDLKDYVLIKRTDFNEVFGK